MRVLRTFVVAALMATTAWTSTHAAERVDLLLVLAADVSGSMDESKFELQRSGYAAAFSSLRLIEAIRLAPWTIMSLKGATSLCRLVGSAAMNPGTKKCPSRSASHHTEGVILAVNGVIAAR